MYAFNEIMKPSALKRCLRSTGDSKKLTFNGTTVDIEERLQESECNAAESTFRGYGSTYIVLSVCIAMTRSAQI